MKIQGSIALPYGRVLWGTTMALCLLSGFILVMRKIPVRAPKGRSTDLLSRSAAVPRLAQGSRFNSAAFPAGSAAQPRLVAAYGKLPLSFEINKGQSDARVKFLSRGSGYSLFLTGNEAVLALKKSGVRSQKLVAPPFRAAHPGSADLFSKSAVFPALLATPEQFKDTFAPGDEALVPNPESRTPAALRMKLVDANPRVKVSGLEELPGKSNYFIGNDPKKWRTNVSNYAKVKYGNVYPGVDLVYYGNQGQLEYDFVVQPGANPRQIALQLVASASSRHAAKMAALRVDRNGDLVVGTEGGEVIFHKPVVYQQNDDGKRRPIDARYFLSTPQSAIDNRQSTISFHLGPYDRRRPVVIDPTLAYSTYLGSGQDSGIAIAVDASGNAYVTGFTDSSDFPTTPGAFRTTSGGGYNAFVSKLNPAGSALVYSTYLGVGAYEVGGTSIAVDPSGNAYVTGATGSSSFPTTPGAFQTALRGPSDGFVSKLNADGSALVYSTYLGGSGDEGSNGIAVDAAGDAYVAGDTNSSNFPTTPGAFQIAFRGGGLDAFVSKLNATGSALVYSTYLGGGDLASGIAVDASADAYVTGYTASSDFPTTPGAFSNSGSAFITKLNALGSGLAYSTRLGGTGFGSGIAVDKSGNAYVTGQASSGFPTTPGAFQTTSGGDFDAFVSKLNTTGSDLVYSTFLGGSGSDEGFGLAVDTSGNAYVTGDTTSSNFPTTVGAFQTTYGGTCGVELCFDAFVSKLNAGGSSLLYSTFLGGSDVDVGDGIATDALGTVYVTGWTGSSNFPTTTGASQTTLAGGVDAFVARINPAGVPLLLLTPSSLTFAPQVLGTTSPAQQTTLKNIGGAALNVTSIVASGDFAQTNNCAPSLAPAGFCTLSVTFTPTAAGIRIGALTITDNAPGSPHKLPLSGTGGIPSVSLTPASLTFTSQAVGTTSPAQPTTLKNTGSGPLSITSIAVSGDFAQTNTCGSLVNPGASCTLNVTFKPTATGTRTGTISITDDATGSAHHVLLTGTGFNGGPVVSLTPTSLTFAAQAVGTFSLAKLATLKNTGGGTLKITSIGRSGDFYEGNNCPSSLLPGASCTLRVTFTPTSPGTKSSAVIIADNAPGSPHKVQLSGTGSGTGSIMLTLSPAALSFGTVRVGTTSSTQTVTLTNVGTVAASFLDPFGFASGENLSFFYKDPHCGTSLAPKASCTVSVFFKPLATGTRMGFFLVRQGAASKQIPLSGTGTP